MIALAFCILVTVCYLCLSAWVTRGVPESLSATYYTLGSNGWLFQLVMMCIGFTLLPVWLELSDVRYQWMAFISCGSLVFVGSAPSFRLPLQGAVHYASAVLCCVCAVVWQVLVGLWDVTLFFAVLGGMLTLQFGNYMWWLEVSVIASLYGNLWRIL